MAPNGKRYLLGLGNYARGDDGVGLHVVEYVWARGLDRDFQALELKNDGMQLLTLFEPGTDRIVVVDCAMIDRDPGDYLLFRPEDVTSRKAAEGISTHEGDVLKLVEMGRALGLPVPDLQLLAVQPESLEMEMQLSETVAARVPEYARAAIDALG